MKTARRWFGRIGFVVLACAVLLFLGSRPVNAQVGVIWYHGPARVPLALLLADVGTTLALAAAAIAATGWALVKLYRLGWGR